MPAIYLVFVVQGSLSAFVLRVIPAVTQVDEKGYEGNTTVVTGHLCWRKHGQRNRRTGGSCLLQCFTSNIIVK